MEGVCTTSEDELTIDNLIHSFTPGNLFGKSNEWLKVLHMKAWPLRAEQPPLVVFVMLSTLLFALKCGPLIAHHRTAVDTQLLGEIKDALHGHFPDSFRAAWKQIGGLNESQFDKLIKEAGTYESRTSDKLPPSSSGEVQ